MLSSNKLGKITGEIAIWGLSTGLVIYFIFLKVLNYEPDSSWYGTVMIATLYAASFVILGHVSMPYINAYFPFHRKQNLVYQILLRTFYLLIGFLIPTVIVETLWPVDGSVLNFDAGTGLVVILISLIAGILGNTIHQLVHFYQEKAAAEQAAKELEITALKAQIKPHFLFNSLNSIAGLIKTDPDKAESITEDLADFFRYTLNTSQKSLVTLEEELEAVTTYMNIEQSRFEQLEWQANISDNLKHYLVPVLVIQPLVENAVKHGLKFNEGKGSVIIAAMEQSNMIHLEVTDNGPGFTYAEDQDYYLKGGHGLTNVKNRIEHQWPKNGKFTLQKNGVTLTFPKLAAYER